MLDVRETIVDKLEETTLPVYFEDSVTELVIPCITYKVINDSVKVYTEGLGYSNIRYQIKLWTNSVNDLVTYTANIDNKLRSIGLERTMYTDLSENDLLIGVLQYKGTIKEYFN